MDSRPEGRRGEKWSKQKKDGNLALSASTIHFPNDWAELILCLVSITLEFLCSFHWELQDKSERES